MPHALLEQVALLALAAHACAPPPPPPPDTPVVPVEIADVEASEGAGGAELPAVVEAPPDKPPPPIGWRDDVEPAIDAARRAMRPALLYIRADWAVAAIELDRELWSDPEVRRAMRGVEAIRIDVTSNDATAQAHMRRWFADGVPMLIVLDRAGHEQRRFRGRPEAAELVAALDALNPRR